MKNNRIALIDALKGFSLLGIFIINAVVLGYSFSNVHKVGQDVLRDFLTLIGESSFMPIFTFLFGYSLIKLVESLQRKHTKIIWYLIRRFLMLILIGAFHSLLWNGDILFTYGIIGFLLLFLIDKKTKTLIIWGIVIFVLSILTNAQLMPLFLFGMAAGKTKLFYNIEKEYIWYKIGIVLIPIGLYLKYIGTVNTMTALTTMSLNLGALFLAVGYILTFAYFFYGLPNIKLFKYLEAVGKLSLTNL